jgi:rhodanese-related sulfurtransferase
MTERFLAVLIFKDKKEKLKDVRLVETDYSREAIIGTISGFKRFICDKDCNKDGSKCYKCKEVEVEIDNYLDWACNLHDIFEMQTQGLIVYNNLEI